MSETISCPHCRRRLVLPEAVIGQLVQCPSCRETFTAAVEAPPHRPPPPREVPVRDEPFPRPTFDPLDDSEEFNNPEHPHRGVFILILGLMSLALSCLPLAGCLLGGIAVSMASTDLVEMARRKMDPAGKHMTEAGKTCAIVAIVISTASLFICCLISVGN